MTNSVNLFDGVHSALAFKAPCLATSDSPITLSGLQTVGGTATTEFTINVENDPGASGLDVSWSVHP